jgi:hypothetical protein
MSRLGRSLLDPTRTRELRVEVDMQVPDTHRGHRATRRPWSRYGPC